MKGEGYFGERRDKTVFYPSAGVRRKAWSVEVTREHTIDKVAS